MRKFRVLGKSAMRNLYQPNFSLIIRISYQILDFVLGLNGGWPMKQFVIMSSCYVLLTQYVADMLTDIAEHPCGFDAVLRCAQIVNHTDLVDPYVFELKHLTN